MTNPEVNGNIRKGRWVEDILTPIVNDLGIFHWAENVLTEYSSLPKVNSQERKRVRNLTTQTADRLLQDLQRIEIAPDVWRNQLGQGDSGNSGGSFYELVKTESAELIKLNWENVTAEQLADLIGIYTNSPSTQDFAKEMLGSYFKGPSSRRQRIDAYYTLAYSALHLAEDDNAFTQAIRIGLHDTDILPKDPNLIEQTLLLSLPYNEEEIVFQKLLIAKNVMFQLSFLSSEDLGEVRQKHYDFLSTHEKLKKKWNEEQAQAIKQIGSDRVTEINNATMAFDLRREDILSEAEKLELKNTWPFNLFFDENDPLNQKFQKVFPQMTAWK